MQAYNPRLGETSLWVDCLEIGWYCASQDGRMEEFLYVRYGMQSAKVPVRVAARLNQQVAPMLT
jgi:hypothetical protein